MRRKPTCREEARWWRLGKLRQTSTTFVCRVCAVPRPSVSCLPRVNALSDGPLGVRVHPPQARENLRTEPPLCLGLPTPLGQNDFGPSAATQNSTRRNASLAGMPPGAQRARARARARARRELSTTQRRLARGHGVRRNRRRVEFATSRASWRAVDRRGVDPSARKWMLIQRPHRDPHTSVLHKTPSSHSFNPRESGSGVLLVATGHKEEEALQDESCRPPLKASTPSGQTEEQIRGRSQQHHFPRRVSTVNWRRSVALPHPL